jgi:small-conductance mechanosensitive channel
VVVGVDYDDDHNLARQVIRDALSGVEGVYDDPPVQVVLIELGDSSVNFEVRFWTDPQTSSVVETTDRVLSEAKTAIEEHGLTIPWPVTTLKVDQPVVVRGGNHSG